MKRRFAGLTWFVLSVVLLFSQCVYADFVQSGNETMYQTADGKYLTGLQKINGKLYYFNASGYLQKNGWVTAIDGKTYYATADGSLAVNQWIDNYYVNENGEKVSGPTKINGKLYYISPTTGKKLKGKFKDASGKRYITNKKGVLYSSQFFYYNGKRYYAKEDGSLAIGLTKIGAYTYFFKNSGIMVTNAKKKGSDGYYYYFKKNGRAACNKWVKIKKKYYYFESDGRMATNKYIGNWYVGANGVRVKASQAPKTGVINKDGKYYYADSSGNIVVNQWVQSGNDTYYAGPDGVLVTGLQTIGDAQYCFDTSCKLLRNTVTVVNGVSYSVDANGRVVGTTTSAGTTIAEFAKQFVGNPYVYGGTSLTNGADCSGFCYAVYGHFGIQLMRVADDQMDGPSAAYVAQGYKQGVVIPDANLAPGDLVFYGSASYATHVAMYIGNNQVVHACNTKLGIIISDIDYVHNRVHNKNMRYWA